MALPSLTEVNDWSSAFVDAGIADTYFNAKIVVYDPHSDTTTTDYDPVADSGGSVTPTVVIAERRARIQPMKSRAAVHINGSDEWGTYRLVKIQTDLLPNDPPIRKGFEVRITDGGNDPTLTGFAYQVMTSLNSSWAPIRTIECISDLAASPAIA